MLISKAMTAAMCEQIGNELAASNQYVSIAVYFDGEGLPALAKHFYKQAAEERQHAMRFVKYLVDAGATPEIPAIPAPRAIFTSAEDAVRLSLDSEMRVTAQINALMDLAIKESDHLSKNALEWFINEQREEVSSMDTLLRMVKRAGEPGLFFVENFLLQGGLEEGPAEGEAESEA
ncbi:MAG: ferritin [Gemmatimonadetes bacterium]|jgi:ferritin|nr:ferritin [Gemmatimonadota bacterium]MCC7322950.1 ferritin [Gemmatimonadaceae bacterium]MBK6843728.1 ferritin [Gemmatimonadota bacterium]MBK7833177.1 ferritin [Gemmatimonadota bacterium]MBK8057689.1 ferritin [Gemmatimonadota bacterium]